MPGAHKTDLCEECKVSEWSSAPSLSLSLPAYRVRLSCLLNVMCCYDHRLLSRFGNVHQVIPNALTQQWIHAHGRLVQNEQLRIVHQGNSEAHTTLLTTAKILHQTLLRWQIEEVEQKLQTLQYLLGLHAEYPAEIHHGLLNGELAVQCNLLGHIAHTLARHTGTACARLAAQHKDLARVQTATTDNA